MKRLAQVLVITFLLLFCVNLAHAGIVIFQWDPHSGDLIRFTAYRHSAPDVQAITSNIWLQIYPPGENPDVNNLLNVEYTVNVDGDYEFTYDVKPDGTWYFVLTATDVNWAESGRSNEVFTTIDDSQPPILTQKWNFSWTLLDLNDVPDLAGYRIYLLPASDPVIRPDSTVIGEWDTAVVLPVTLDIPEGEWYSALVAFDTNGVESVQPLICALNVDGPPPTPTGYSCNVRLEFVIE